MDFSADVGRTQRFPPTSFPLQEKVRILRHQQRGGPAWSHSDTVSEGVGGHSEEPLLHSLVGSRRASIRVAGAPAFVAGLTESDHARPSEKSADGSGLGPFGRPEPFCLFDSAELRLVCWEKYTTGVRAASVRASEESGHFGWDSVCVLTRWRTHQPLISRSCVIDSKVDPHGHIWTQGTSYCVVLL